MINLKAKSILMGGLSFLAAILVVGTLVVANNKLNYPQQISSINEAVKKPLQQVKTAIAEKTVSLAVCSQQKTSSSTGTTCDVTDTETFSATAGTYTLYADIVRGDANQTQESFSLTLNGVSLGNFMDDGVDGTNTKVLLKSGVAVAASNTLVMTHLAPNSNPATPNSVNITKIYLEGSGVDPNDSSSCSLKLTDPSGVEKETFTVGDKGKITWNVDNAYPETNKVYFSCGSPESANPNGDTLELFQMSGSADLTFGKAGDYWCVINVMNGAGSVVNPAYGAFTCGDLVKATTAPTCEFFKFDKAEIKVGENVGYSWKFGGGYIPGVPTKLKCDLAIPDGTDVTNVAISGNSTTAIYTVAGTEKCSVYFNGSNTPACSSGNLIVGSSPSPSPSPSPTTYSCTGTTPANSTICSGDGDGLTADVAKTLVGTCGTPKCEYFCNSGYSYQASSKTCVAVTNGSCGSASKTYPSSTTSYGNDTFCTSGTPSPSAPVFPAVGSSTSWTCQGSSGGVNSSCRAIRSEKVVNGDCGSADGDTFSSAPSSHLCSEGNESSVSGSGPWYWNCNGVNGGTNANCSASKVSVSYSPTVTVVPVTQYTYSYTAKVAPTTGVATNVALLLSVSAVATLGIWLALKKIKG